MPAAADAMKPRRAAEPTTSKLFWWRRWRRQRAEADMLSSVWVMACLDDTPVLLSYSVAYRLGGGTTSKEVLDLVQRRRELFRFGLTSVQSESWKDRYRCRKNEKGQWGPPQKKLRAEWLDVFDDKRAEAEAEKDRVRRWLNDKTISTSACARKKFLHETDITGVAFRSQFRIDPDFKADPSNIETVNWGLEHIERLRKGYAERQQMMVAGIVTLGGVLLGGALTTFSGWYQVRPAETARLTAEYQARLEQYGALSKAVAGAAHAAKTRDYEALNRALAEISSAATTLSSLLDPDTRRSLRQARDRANRACASGVQGSDSARKACLDAVRGLQHLLDRPLIDIATK